MAVAICLSIASFLLIPDLTTDIQLHDTYLVVSIYHTILCMAVLLGTWMMVYFLTRVLIRQPLNLRLTVIHFWLTILGLGLFIWISFSQPMIAFPRIWSNPVDDGVFMAAVGIGIVISILASPFIFILNLIVSFRK